MKITKVLSLTALFIVLLCLSGSGAAQELSAPWPKRVLITNDDGIDSVGIIELARAFANVAETYVVAPRENRSGSTHYLSFLHKGTLEVEPRTLGDGIQAYAVDGFPADCVVLALTGIMRENPPDLVISGINDGPNLGMSWISSGTIGAARMAAFSGTPAIAVSGLLNKPDAVDAATQWVIQLAQSPVARELQPPQFLSVNIPRVSPSEIKGIRIAKPADMYEIPVFARIPEESGEDGREVWGIEEVQKREYVLPDDSDEALYAAGYIVVVPMIADEHDKYLLSALAERPRIFPEWPSP